MTATAVSAIAAVMAAGVTGWFAWLARKAAGQAPESVAGGYSKLVSDMRVQHDLLRKRVAELELEMAEDRRMIAELALKVRWLLDAAEPDAVTKFYERFADGGQSG